MPGGEAQADQGKAVKGLPKARQRVEHNAVGQHIHRGRDLSGNDAYNVRKQQRRHKAALGQEFDEFMPGLLFLPVEAHGKQQKQRRQHADGEADLANGERLAIRSALATDDLALEHLDTFLFTFDDTEVHFHGVAGLESGNIKAHLFAFDLFDDGHVLLLKEVVAPSDGQPEVMSLRLSVTPETGCRLRSLAPSPGEVSTQSIAPYRKGAAVKRL